MSKVISANDLEAPAGKTIDSSQLESAPKTPGATGSWTEMSPVEKGTRMLLSPLANLGQGAVEAGKAVAHSPIDIYNAATTVKNPGEEKYPFIALAAKRLLAEPTVENAKAWWEGMKAQAQSDQPLSNMDTYLDNLSNAMGMIPGIGPAVKDVLQEVAHGETMRGAGKALGYTLAGKAAEELVGSGAATGKKALNYSQNGPMFFTQPEGHLRASLKPDLDDAGIKVAGNELKAGEGKIGKPVKDVDSAREAAQAQFKQELMPTRRAIIDPQAHITIPGSRRMLVDAKVAAIPKDILPGSPEYTQLVDSINKSIPTDLNIGQLEDMSTSLNSQNRAYHQAKLSQALSKVENANGAINVATEQAARNIMQEGMDKQGLGGAEELRGINQRIGSLIKIEDSIDTAEKAARVQATVPRFKRMTQVTSPPTINEGIASAMKSWKNTSAPIRPNLVKNRIAGTAANAPTTMNVGTTPWDQLTPQQLAELDKLGISSDEVRRQHAERLANQAGQQDTTNRDPITGEILMPPTPVSPSVTKISEADRLRMGGEPTQAVADTERRDPTTGELTLPPQKLSKIKTKTAGGTVTQIKHGETVHGEAPPTTIEGEQPPLQPTVIKPTGRPSTPIFGERQTSLGETQAHQNVEVPVGSKYVFQSKTLDGRTMYHYQTPEGEMISSDRELDLDKGDRVQAQTFSGHKPPEPPKRQSKKNL